MKLKFGGLIDLRAAHVVSKIGDGGTFFESVGGV